MADKAIDKKTGQPVEIIETTVHHTDAEAVQKALEKEYRTDHLTLPNIAPVQDKFRDKVSDFERKIILREGVTEETVVDDKGTTLKEWRDRIERGIMPKDAPEEALAGVGKHSIDIVDEEGQEKVVITAPVTGEETVIAMPNTKEGEVPFGSELMHKTTPVPEILDVTKSSDKIADPSFKTSGSGSPTDRDASTSASPTPSSALSDSPTTTEGATPSTSPSGTGGTSGTGSTGGGSKA